MSDYLIREIGSAPNIDVCYRVQVACGTRTGHLESLVLADTVPGARRSVPADALFVLIGAQPRTQWLSGTLARDRQGFIRTGPDLPAGTCWPPGRPPLPLETGLPGVFAAGDVRRGSVKRVASAVGEGAATIPLVHRHLHTARPDPAARGPAPPPRSAHRNQHPPCRRIIPVFSQQPGERADAHPAHHDHRQQSGKRCQSREKDQDRRPGAHIAV